MEFDREVFDLMPSGSKTFNLIGLKMPSDKDIFFRAKQKETLDKYQAARRFMYELETDDWDHYFHKLEDENGNIYFQNVLKAQWYEAAIHILCVQKRGRPIGRPQDLLSYYSASSMRP